MLCTPSFFLIVHVGMGVLWHFRILAITHVDAFSGRFLVNTIFMRHVQEFCCVWPRGSY